MNRPAVCPSDSAICLDQSPASLREATSLVMADSDRREQLFRERRAEPRRVLHQAVLVTPVTGDERSFHRVGEPVNAFVRDISTSGVGLVHRYPFGSGHVVATFKLLDGGEVSFFVQIKWSNSLGDFGMSSGGQVVAVVKSSSEA